MIGHKMILASAGSGKTYALTNRFVRLLASGAKPERIVALTFTRKAAGEFFDEILNKLAGASVSPTKAALLARDIARPELGTEDFLGLLRTVVDAMHRLRLGTFDGFFARIARIFPIELGLTGEFEILQEHTSRRERGRVLRRMFQRAGGLTEAQREFIEAFKRATFGMEEKQLGARLDRFIDEHQEVFLSSPAVEQWGNAEQIWPEGFLWIHGVVSAEAVAALRGWIDGAPLQEKPKARWIDFLTELAEWSPGLEPPLAMKFVLEKALASWPELNSGRATLKFFSQKQELDQTACGALVTLVRQVVGGEIMRRLEITHGIHAVLAGYEAVYHDAVRRAGKLTFGDVQRLLMPENSGARILSRTAADDGRLFIDYRLDAEIDHWLLDEFQDTSFGQWSVLKNLVDEAVQDASGARSFFYVGDIKQAIFAWREGDPRLFREIFDQYNSAQPGLIAEEHLLESYRSGPSIIAMVNQVFGAAPVLSELFGEGAVTWNREWKEHRSAKPELTGQVALLHADTVEERFKVTLDLLLEIDPLERGLSCAILVQKNATAAALADYLRREGGFPAIAESDLHVCTDNPLGAALLALFKVAAHPGDNLAREHVAMSPLSQFLSSEGLNSADAVVLRLLGQVQSEGFERTVDFWVNNLESLLEADDSFSRIRARQFTSAAGLFDATGSRDVAEFIEFMERHVVREPESASAIRVMTVHKSKGLGFDVVILPDLEGKKLSARRDGLAVSRGVNREVEWVMDLPGKFFIEQDPVLGGFIRSAEADAAYENLSLLYVAMTRAKRAMYMVMKPSGKSTSHNFTKLLEETLGGEAISAQVGRREFVGGFCQGDPSWFLSITHVTKAPRRGAVMAPVEIPQFERSLRLPARRPSEGRGIAMAASRFFAAQELSGAVDLGLVVHRLFAEVEWATSKALDDLAQKWRRHGAAAELALECLRRPGLREIWQHRLGSAIWRERTFEVVVDGTWITGVFDRVEVRYDAAGRVLGATVFDFKTDRDDIDVLERYRPQLNLYRSAVGQLAGLQEENVDCEIVLVRQMTRIMVPRKGT